MNMHTHDGTNSPRRPDAGVTLVELAISLVIFGMVLVILNTVFISSNRVYGQTAVRARQQMSERVGLTLMMTELRTAGCDPGMAGIEAIPVASAISTRVQADYNGNGAIQTAEPSETVTYTFDANAETLSRDPGTGAQVMMRNVTNCTFRYFDANNVELIPPLTTAQRGTIRSIGIAITTETPRGGEISSDTRVTLRND
jgi:prepilin-type N-terminal cleavage/methylation domain-containing protein